MVGIICPPLALIEIRLMYPAKPGCVGGRFAFLPPRSDGPAFEEAEVGLPLPICKIIWLVWSENQS